ncbi:MAG: hypothetical protein ACU84J_16450 [Gammaproteobacteria bacterium]
MITLTEIDTSDGTTKSSTMMLNRCRRLDG